MALSLGFIIAFTAAGVAILMGLMIFGEITTASIDNYSGEYDPNCNVNYNHHTNCLYERMLYDGSKVGFNPESNATFGWTAIAVLPFALVFIIWRLFI